MRRKIQPDAPARIPPVTAMGFVVNACIIICRVSNFQPAVSQQMWRNPTIGLSDDLFKLIKILCKYRNNILAILCR